MTREEILERVRFQGELRGLAPSTLHNYWLYVRQYQNHYGKPADELGISDVQKYLHHLLYGRKLKKRSVDLVNTALFVPAGTGDTAGRREDPSAWEKPQAAGHSQSG